MNSKERTQKLSALAREIAVALNRLVPLRPWTFVEPSEDTYSVYLRNAGKARIYFQFDDWAHDEPKRLSVSGYMHIGKNNSHVEVYEKGERLTAPRITVGTARGAEAIAKDITRRFLPEYLRIFALAEEKVAKEIAYENAQAALLSECLRVCGKVRASHGYAQGKGTAYLDPENYRKNVEFSCNDKTIDAKFDDLTLEQVKHIIEYLKEKE